MTSAADSSVERVRAALAALKNFNGKPFEKHQKSEIIDMLNRIEDQHFRQMALRELLAAVAS